jgi:hypothetical protein
MLTYKGSGFDVVVRHDLDVFFETCLRVNDCDYDDEVGAIPDQ